MNRNLKKKKRNASAPLPRQSDSSELEWGPIMLFFKRLPGDSNVQGTMRTLI